MNVASRQPEPVSRPERTKKPEPKKECRRIVSDFMFSKGRFENDPIAQKHISRLTIKKRKIQEKVYRETGEIPAVFFRYLIDLGIMNGPKPPVKSKRNLRALLNFEKTECSEWRQLNEEIEAELIQTTEYDFHQEIRDAKKLIYRKPQHRRLSQDTPRRRYVRVTG